MKKILRLLSDTVPMSYPELMINFSLPERRHLATDLEQLVTTGLIEHHRRPVDGVTISTFKLPAGAHKQMTIFDIK